MSQVVYEYKIECYTKFSVGYVYSHNSRHHEIWADSTDKLKQKVWARNLPWDNKKVLQRKTCKCYGLPYWYRFG